MRPVLCICMFAFTLQADTFTTSGEGGSVFAVSYGFNISTDILADPVWDPCGPDCAPGTLNSVTVDWTAKIGAFENYQAYYYMPQGGDILVAYSQTATATVLGDTVSQTAFKSEMEYGGECLTCSVGGIPFTLSGSVTVTDPNELTALSDNPDYLQIPASATLTGTFDPNYPFDAGLSSLFFGGSTYFDATVTYNYTPTAIIITQSRFLATARVVPEPRWGSVVLAAAILCCLVFRKVIHDA